MSITIAQAIERIEAEIAERQKLIETLRALDDPAPTEGPWLLTVPKRTAKGVTAEPLLPPRERPVHEGVRKPARRRPDVARMVVLHGQGWPDGKIAAELGCAQSVVSYNLRKRNLPPNGAKPAARPDGAVERVSSMAPVTMFLKMRGVPLVKLEDDRWQSDGRILTRAELIEMANVKKTAMGAPPFKVGS